MITTYYVTNSDLEAISLVKFPAIEEDFETFSSLINDIEDHFCFSIDEEKHIAFGPVMIPDKPIYRKAADGTPYYIIFTKDIIENLAQQAAKKSIQFNLEHSGENVSSIYIIESFISRPDLSPLKFEGVPYGSWFVSLKIEDDQIWADVKSGKYKGFSIECGVNIEQEIDPIDQEINNILN